MKPPSTDRLLLQAVIREWEWANFRKFGSRLRQPRFELTASSAKLGSWHPSTRTLHLSRVLVAEHAWGSVVAVLRHEMVHQYVSEVLRITHETPHGPTFVRVCRERGIDPAARGIPSDQSQTESKVVRRIRKLLALAESPNVHEAQAAMNAAQKCMLRHNLESVDGPTAQYDFRSVGPVKLRFDRWEYRLVSLLAEHFFVQVLSVPAYMPDKGKWGRTTECMGTPENLAMAVYVHDVLRETALRLWRDHKARTKLNANRARRSYLLGVISGFDHKLEQQQQAHQREGLVWVGDPELKHWMAARHGSIRSVRAKPLAVHSAYRSGHQDGQSIVLHRPITSETRRGLTLPGPSDG